MNKKLSKTDYLMTLLFLFVIIGVLGAFFYGIKVGKDKTTTKYELLMAEKQEMAKELTAYHQQYLVSFYHTIYLPYRDFQKKWFEHLDAIELESKSVDPQSVFKELSKLADEKFKTIESMSMPSISPLLQEAHSNYLKSLKLFSAASNNFRSKVSSQQGTKIIEMINNDVSFKEAKNFALLAQSDYYSSIVRWNESMNPNLTGIELADKNDVSLNEWAHMNLNIKNEFVSNILKGTEYYAAFYPQDLTIRIDEMIANGQAKKMDFTTIKPMIEMLVDTNAVRSGDYLKKRQIFYKNETIPQLPFFYE
ncbi:MAG: hypothetical protein WD424_08515 [Paenibacillaceae bacterium]